MSIRVRGIVLKPGTRVTLLANGRRRAAIFRGKYRNCLNLEIPYTWGRKSDFAYVFDHRIRLAGESDEDVSIEAQFTQKGGTHDED